MYLQGFRNIAEVLRNDTHDIFHIDYGFEEVESNGFALDSGNPKVKLIRDENGFKIIPLNNVKMCFAGIAYVLCCAMADKMEVGEERIVEREGYDWRPIFQYATGYLDVWGEDAHLLFDCEINHWIKNKAQAIGHIIEFLSKYEENNQGVH